jgi:hypothetical protein
VVYEIYNAKNDLVVMTNRLANTNQFQCNTGHAHHLDKNSKSRDNQCQAMMNYAQPVSSINIRTRVRGHQYTPIVMIATLLDEERHEQREKLIKKAFEAGVIYTRNRQLFDRNC